MSSAGAFHAPTFHQRVKGPGSRVKTPVSGERWHGSFTKWDHASFSWKTPQGSLLAGSDEFSETWPNWGSMRNGECWERTTLEPHTTETGFGSLPTPTATDARGRTYHYSRGNKNKPVLSLLGVAKLPTPPASDWKGQYTWQTVKRRMDEARKGVRLPEELCRLVGNTIAPNPDFWDWMMGWPIGSSGLKPLGTARFQSWLLSHGAYSPEELGDEAAVIRAITAKLGVSPERVHLTGGCATRMARKPASGASDSPRRPEIAG